MMLGPTELKRRLTLGAEDREEGIWVVPSPTSSGTEVGRSASIDLRLGRWFLTFQQSKTSSINLLESRSAEEFEAAEGRMYYIPFGAKFVVHPGRFVLATTLEWIKMPSRVGGYITGKSTIGRRGLVIETAAGLHPEFSGCITLELSNCGEIPIAVVPGMQICQVFFHALHGASTDGHTSFGGRRKPTFGPYRLDSFVERAIEYQTRKRGRLV